MHAGKHRHVSIVWSHCFLVQFTTPCSKCVIVKLPNNGPTYTYCTTALKHFSEWHFIARCIHNKHLCTWTMQLATYLLLYLYLRRRRMTAISVSMTATMRMIAKLKGRTIFSMNRALSSVVIVSVEKDTVPK